MIIKFYLLDLIEVGVIFMVRWFFFLVRDFDYCKKLWKMEECLFFFFFSNLNDKIEIFC